MRRWSLFTILCAALGAAAVAVSCGEVPTLPDGVAYITPVQVPSPAVAAGDTLRDSLGFATPLRVHAFGNDSQEIMGLAVTFLPTALPSAVKIDANGYVVALPDTVSSVQVVGRVGDRLQTPPATLLVVPQPQSIGRPDGATKGDTTQVVPIKDLPVIVTGTAKGATTTVNGIIVRYRIDSIVPAGLPAGSALLTNAAGVSQRPDASVAVDTTKSAGNATSKVVAGTGVQTVFVSASARRLDGVPLQGSPVRFRLDVHQ
jgi:hypothetical protein